MRWKSRGEWCQTHFTQDSAVRSVTEQSSTHLKLKTVLVALPPRSCFNHHIRNSRAQTVFQFSHRFHRLPCERRDYEASCSWCSLLVSSTWRLPEDGFSMCHCPPHARPNLATCYGWLIIFDGGLLSEWSKSYLGLVNASVTTRLSSPPRLLPPSSSSFLVFFLRLFRAAQRSPGPLLGEKQRMSVKLDLYICVRGVLQRLCVLPELM